MRTRSRRNDVEAASQENEDSHDAMSQDSFDNHGTTIHSDEIKQEMDDGDALCQEEFDMVTIEDVDIHVLTSRIRKIIQEIIKRGLQVAGQLFEVAVKIIYRSSMFEHASNPVVDTIIKGFTSILLLNEEIDEECQQSEKALVMFIAKLAVVCKNQKCEELLTELFRIIEKYYYCSESQTRRRVCHLMALILIEANLANETEQIQGDIEFFFGDEGAAECEEIIPAGIMEQWANKLSLSVLDKCPRVREAAVHALAQFDHSMTLNDVNGNPITVNKLISKSMSDIDPSVRSTAVRCVRFVENSDIDKYMDFVDNSKENKIRHQMVVRLARDVHMLSFSEEQRFRLINILMNTESARMQDVIHQHLVESWMNVVSENISFLSLFHYNDSFEEIEKDCAIAFPSVVLEYLNPIDDPKATSIFIKFAITRYIRFKTSQQTNKIDFSRFLEVLTEMSDYQCEILGFLRRNTYRLVPEHEHDEDDKDIWLKKTYYRVFFSRNLIDVIFSLTADKSASSASIRDRALRLLVLGIVGFSRHVERFCDEYFCDEELYSEHGECLEVLLENVFHLFNVIIKENDDSLEKTVYKNLIEKLLQGGKYLFSTEMVHYLTSVKLDLCEEDRDQIEEACDWLYYAANDILMTSDTGASLGDDLNEAFENNWVTNRMLRRCTSMILAISQHEEVKKCSVLMSTLLKALIPALLSNRHGEIPHEGIELIGHASIIDFKNSVPYMKLLLLLLKSDKDRLLKSAAVNSIIRVVNSHGFANVAAQLFNDDGNDLDYSDHLANLLESVANQMDGISMVQFVRDIISLFSHGLYFWPAMMGFVLRVVFSREYREYNLPKFFKKFCAMSVLNVQKKVHLMRSFLKCIEHCEEMPESDCDVAIMEMTTFVCKHLNTLTTVENEENEGTGEHDAFLIEFEFARRIAKKAIRDPLSWPLRHIFSGLTSSLYLEFIPLVKLYELRNVVYDSVDELRNSGVKEAPAAARRFLGVCEKIIGVKERIVKMQGGTCPEIKIEDADEGTGRNKKRRNNSQGDRKSKEKKGRIEDGKCDWDEEEWIQEWIQDDSIEYAPRPSRSRKRRISQVLANDDKNGGDNNDETS